MDCKALSSVTKMWSFENRFQTFEFIFRFFDIDQVCPLRMKKCSFLKRLLAYTCLLFFICVYIVRIVISFVFIGNRDFITRSYFGDNFGITVVNTNSVTRIANGSLYLIWALHASLIIITIFSEKSKSTKCGLSWVKFIDIRLLQNPELLKMTSELTFFERHKMTFKLTFFILAACYVAFEVSVNAQNMSSMTQMINEESKAELNVAITTFWFVSNAILIFVSSLFIVTAFAQCLFICYYFNNLLTKIIEKVIDKQQQGFAKTDLLNLQKLFYDFYYCIEMANSYLKKYIANFYICFVIFDAFVAFELFVSKSTLHVKILFFVGGIATGLYIIILTYFVGRIPQMIPQLVSCLHQASLTCDESSIVSCFY